MDSASPIAARIAERAPTCSGARFTFAMFTTFKLADDGNLLDWLGGSRSRLDGRAQGRLPHHPPATGHGRAS